MKILLNRVPIVLVIGIGILSLLGQFGRTQTILGYISWYEIGMLLCIMCVLPDFVKNVPRSIKKYSMVVSFMLWAVLRTLVQSLVQGNYGLISVGGAYLSRLALYMLFAGSLSFFLKKKYLTNTKLISVITLWLSLFAALGILQFLIQPDTRIFFYLGWDDHLSRAFATLFDPGYFGLLMVAGVLFVLWLATKIQQFWHQIVLALFLIATALSYSRASYVALCLGVMVLSFLSRSRRMLLVIPMLIMALVLLPKDGGGVGQNLIRTQTLAMRQEVAQKQTQSVSWQDMVVGKGWYYQKLESQDSSSSIERQNSAGIDNVFLLVLLSTGLIGVCLYMLAIRQLWRLSNNVFWKAYFVAALGHSFFSLGVFYPWVMLLLAVTFFLGKEPSSQNK